MMDMKMKHRILGFLVIASVVVIMMPFFQKNKIATPHIAIQETPAFPEQTVSVAAVSAPEVPKSLETAAPLAPQVPDKTPAHTTPVAADDLPAPIAMAPHIKTTLEEMDGLFQLKKPTWLIQVGKFQNKQRALAVAKNLKAHGYSPLLQQYGNKGNIHLYVLSENKVSAANALATELSRNMHLQGVVVYYKPVA